MIVCLATPTGKDPAFILFLDAFNGGLEFLTKANEDVTAKLFAAQQSQ
jgi:hypothetical protein